jgi:hypothetical protein
MEHVHPWQQFGSLLGGFFDRQIRWYLRVSISPKFQMVSLLKVTSLLYGWFWSLESGLCGWLEVPLGSSRRLLARHLDDLWRWWIDYPSPNKFLFLNTKIYAINSTYILHTMDLSVLPILCRYTFETDQETSQWHCKCQLTLPCGIARLHIGGVGISLSGQISISIHDKAVAPPMS